MVEFGTRMGSIWTVLFCFASVFAIVSAERSIVKMEVPRFNVTSREPQQSFLTKALNFLWQSGESGYQHVWPVSAPIRVEIIFPLSDFD